MAEEAQLSEREQLAASRGVATVGSRLTASWRRSASYGVSLDAVSPTFAGGVDDGSLFYECGQEVLRGLHATLADEPVSLMLTDSEGLVLSRVCGERGMLRALDDVYLAPGFGYSEREAGTTGLGLALADRVPSLVRADQHYCTKLWGYTCAAVPVMDPTTGELVGSVNLTTWAQQSFNLLLALAQSAAGNTAALMLARGRGRTSRPVARGEVFRVHLAHPDEDEPLPALSGGWGTALAEVEAALAAGRSVGVVGEPGVGKTALLAAALGGVRPHDRVLTARPPQPQDAPAWLALWSPELGKENTSIIVGRVDALPSWAAAELAGIVTGAGRSFTVTAPGPDGVPAPLRELLDTVVELPALRHRLDDVLPLAHYFGHRARGRAVRFTPAAARALTTFHWPGNVAQLRDVVRAAVARADVVDARHLAAEVFSGATRRLTRIETVQRDEIVRCLREPGTTVAQAATMLGMSRATIYRRIAQYGIRAQGHDAG
ncbi:GAF domain-containing protein [Pseudonocardia sp. GCM10023141]|uniref:GAF domain-containing protein n=1 Tax=Pseudonocardia sp. GCM10023141 TaxID=3252653 RepID=UPI0036095A79